MSRLSTLLIHLAYYPSVAFNRAMCGLRIWNQWDWVDPYLLLGAVPSRRQIKLLHDLGIRTIINLCEEFSGHTAEMSGMGITQFQIPTMDYYCPCEQDLISGMRILHQEIGAKRKTFVHCKAGQGRSATLVLCYLMAARGMTAAQAYTYLKSIRGHLTRRLDQRPTVLAIERKLHEGLLTLKG